MTPERYRLIGQIFDEVLDAPSAARTALLDRACSGDPELRAEVEKLLANHAGASGFLATPAMNVAAELWARTQPALETGARIGHYEIVSELGAGGMGRVYAAKDTRLNRRVAIKVLPPHLAADAEHVRRFEHETRAVTALNHPNILTVYDAGTNNGAPYLVTELLEGQDLRAHLDRGPLPLRTAVDYARQIAAGLAAAHDKGIVHRDLKPENIFVTHDGRIKILDFGLAKLRFANEGGGSVTHLTAPGRVLGTLAYMSPEQIRGAELDPRSDIFSFGAVLFEMCNGSRAFAGVSDADVIAAILDGSPPKAVANSALAPILGRCLEKDPAHRFASARELAVALESARTWNRSLRRVILIGAAILCLAALMTLAVGRPASLEPPAAKIRLSVVPPRPATVFDRPTLSPDGRTLAFLARTDQRIQIWVRSMDSTIAAPLAGTEDADAIFWEPGSQQIGFHAGGMLKKTPRWGGAVAAICEAKVAGGATWNAQGVILFGAASGGLRRVTADGGTPVAVTKVDRSRGELAHAMPLFLPDGERFLFHASNEDPAKTGIYVGSLEGSAPRLLLATESRSFAAAAGHLLYVRMGALLAQRFDFTHAEISGEPVRLARDVFADASGYGAGFSIGGDLLAYVGAAASHRLTWVNRAGKVLGVAGGPGAFGTPRLSRDERQLAVAKMDARSPAPDIEIFDLARGSGTRFTFDAAADRGPLWSPDGRRIAWASNRGGGVANPYWKAASGSGEDELLLRSANDKTLLDWSRDGRFLLYRELDPDTGADLWIVPLEGDRKPRPWLRSRFADGAARFSPDGKWIAYVSRESGRDEVYVQAFAPKESASGAARRISDNGGTRVEWRRDGRELYYTTSGELLMAVSLDPGAQRVGSPRVLADLRGLRLAHGIEFAATGDGRRFLFVTQEEGPAPFTVALNWMEDLKH